MPGGVELAKLERSRNRDDALEVLAGVFDLAGVVSPGSAVDAGSKFLRVFRRRMQDKRRIDAVAMDRQVDLHGESYAEATRIAEGLTAVAQLLICFDAAGEKWIAFGYGQLEFEQ